MRATWLLDVLRDAGLTVLPVPGWDTRGRNLKAVHGVVAHHTGTGPNWTDQRVTDLLVHGRSDLAGPLAQLGLDRTGRYHLVTDGRANHNGYGTWGNDSIGIEAYNAGDGRDPWPTAQLDAYHRGTAAILGHLGLPATKVLAHRETDPRRKPDPVGVDMYKFRAAVARLLTPGDNGMTPEQESKLDKALAEAAAAGLRAAHCEQLLAEVLAALNVPSTDGKRPYPVRTIESALGSNK